MENNNLNAHLPKSKLYLKQHGIPPQWNKFCTSPLYISMKLEVTSKSCIVALLGFSTLDEI